MYICVCRQVTKEEINNQLDNGSSVREIVKKYDCTQCKLCIPYIVDLYKQCSLSISGDALDL